MMNGRDLIDCWFTVESRPRWFASSPAFDAMLRLRFGAWLDQDHQNIGSGADPVAFVARILLFDQLPRNIHRGSRRAFAYDHQALTLAHAVLQESWHRDLPKDARLFLYMPFEHAEDLGLQRLSCRLFAELDDPEILDYAQQHLNIIARFGRFPHRNVALGRVSTADEIAYLEGDLPHFAQKS